jgi:succinate dehydrogenase cytochrome b subunit
MVTSLKEQALKRPPAYRNIHVTQLVSYRLPLAGWASILHRISGAVLFLLLPFAIWLFDNSLTSEGSYDEFVSVFVSGALGLPGWFWKLVTFAAIWSFLLHFCIGLRHLWMDVTHQVSAPFGRRSALVAIVLGTVVALALGAKLFF